MSVLHCGWVMLRIYCSKAKRMRLWPNLDRPVFEMNIVNEENKVTRHKLTQSFVLSLNVKPEFPEGKTNWSCQKSWDLMITSNVPKPNKCEWPNLDALYMK